jgi:hypothetical protein
MLLNLQQGTKFTLVSVSDQISPLRENINDIIFLISLPNAANGLACELVILNRVTFTGCRFLQIKRERYFLLLLCRLAKRRQLRDRNLILLTCL